MIDEIQTMIDHYWVWVKDRTTLRQIDGWSEITTPHLDRHNDYIQIYVRKSEDGFLLTDDGYTINDLELSGTPLDTPRRRQILDTTLRGFGVQLVEGHRLEVKASAGNFAVRKHNLLQAMLAVNDLFYLAYSNVASLFREDVAVWLEDCDIRFTPDVTFKGKSGYDHRFDFVIPKSKTHPERLIHAVNRPDRRTAQSVVFACVDTKENRSSNSENYAILNNRERVVSLNVKEALKSYDVRPILWEERDVVREELAM